jgi:peroxiredoxin
LSPEGASRPGAFSFSTSGSKKMRENIKIGSSFPNFELPDHENKISKLSDLQENDPMVLLLLRGAYCPKDRQFLEQIVVPFSKQCAVGYAKLVSISAESQHDVNSLRLGVAGNWVFLYDQKRTVQSELGLEEYTDPIHKPLIPHVFLLKPKLEVYKIYNGYWYWGRPTLHELHTDLREISSQIRPDWQIDLPHLRENWQKGEKGKFFPYHN